jgi:hypothetical protein
MTPNFAMVHVSWREGPNFRLWLPLFLLWVPAAQTFATFFMSSKTARRESGAVSARLGKAATFSAKLIKTPRYTWHGPVCTPLDVATFDVPPIDEIRKQADLFMNPKPSGITKVPVPAEGGTEERAR